MSLTSRFRDLRNGFRVSDAERLRIREAALLQARKEMDTAARRKRRRRTVIGLGIAVLCAAGYFMFKPHSSTAATVRPREMQPQPTPPASRQPAAPSAEWPLEGYQPAAKKRSHHAGDCYMEQIPASKSHRPTSDVPRDAAADDANATHRKGVNV